MYLHELIRSIRKNNNQTQVEFAMLLSVDRSTISKWETGKEVPSKDKLQLLSDISGENFNNVRTLNFDSKPKNIEAVAVPEESMMVVPVLSVIAQAGYVIQKGDNEYLKDMELMLLPREYDKGNYLVIEVQGDSMEKENGDGIVEGSKLLVKELPIVDWKDKLFYKKYIFVIAYEDGVIVKQIVDHNLETGIIICRSWNPVYNDIKINLDNVYRLFYVKKGVDVKFRPIF